LLADELDIIGRILDDVIVFLWTHFDRRSVRIKT